MQQPSGISSFSKSYSHLYDYIYHDKDYAAETAFVEKLLLNRVEGKKLLDFGCGTGRHSVEFQKRGWLVTGVDKSPDMLAEAGKRLSAIPVAFSQEIALTDRFDCVVSLFAVLNYLDPQTELPQALRKIREVMNPKAIAVFEVWNGVAVPFLSEARKSKRLPGPEEEELLRTTDIRLDWLRQTMDIEFRLFRPPHEDEWFSEAHRMYYLTPMQFESELKASGFQVEDILPAFGDRPVRHDDFNLLYVCGVAENA